MFALTAVSWAPLRCRFPHASRCLTTELDRWQRRCDRLSQLQRRIRFPKLEMITVDGQSFELPLRSVAPIRAPSKEELEYLVGFFDGDGCVSMRKSTGQMSLCVSQAVDSAGVLLLFRSLLGGSVMHERAATGSRKAVVKWQVSGSGLQDAATTLSSVPSMKQAQLRIAAQGTVSRPDLALAVRQLQLLKQPQHAPSEQLGCSWPYFAGFFDAQGSISVHPLSPSVNLTLSQLNPYILVHFMHVLHQNGLDAWKLYHKSQSSCLVCNSFDVCKQTLEQMLRNGLMVKRGQARLAMTLTKQNHVKIREGISSLNGRQGRSRRLNEDGLLRAKEIKRLQDKMNSASGQNRRSLQRELDELQADHAVQNMMSRCRLLRKDMRQALSQGGQVTPLTSWLHGEEVDKA